MINQRAIRAWSVAVALLALSVTSSATIIYQPADQQITGNSTIGSFTSYSGDYVYIGFTVNWASGSVGNNEFYVLWFDADSSQNIGIKGNEWTSTTSIGTKDFLVRNSSGDGGAYWPWELTIPCTSRMVGLLVKTNPGAANPYDRFYLWVDPSSETIPSPVYATTTGTDATISILGKRAANNNDTVWFRDIVVATTYAEALGSWAPPAPPSVQVFASADFNDLTTGALRNKVGGSGFSGAWYGSADPQVASGDLASALYAKTQSGAARSITGGSNPRHEYRALSSPISGEIWFSCLLENTASSGRAGLSFNPPGGNPFDLQGTAFLELRGTDLVYNFGSGTPTTLTGQASLGQTVLVVGQMILNYSGTSDAINVWLNPNVLDGLLVNDAASITQVGTDFADVIGHLGIFVQTSGSTFDALYISNTSTASFDVTGVELILVPEPSTLALGALGLLACLRRRRWAA